MSEPADNAATTPPETISISHRRILWTLGAVTIILAIAGIWLDSWEFGLGVVVGGVLAIVNYYWLKVSLKRVFVQIAEGGERPQFLAIRYFGRYLTLGAVLLIIFLTKSVPVLAVVLGLASFALAIVVEGLILIFASFFKSEKL